MDEIEEIKRKIDVVDLISQYLTLKKAGANYKAICPFHEEKTPSFMVSPDKQIFKCFGCQKGGSVFDFVMEMEGLNFPEALELLANRAGVVLSRSKSKEQYQKEKDTKSQLYKINELSAQVFHKILLEHHSAEAVRRYLKERGVNLATIKEFSLGYAPEKPVLQQFLQKRGFSEAEIRLAGSPDKFKNRLIFPILDVMGNVVAFSGRALAKDQEPKYINTPETPIFHKSRVIYGLDKAKTVIKKEKKSLIVEGQMDVILSHQAGVKCVVASSGTALTQDHLEILKRYSPDIVFAFDQDEAGSLAAKKAIELAIINEMNVKMVVLPAEIKDAGEAVAKDPQVWRQAVAKAIPAVDWYFDRAFGQTRMTTNKDTNDHELSVDEKKAIARELLPVLKKLPNKIEQAHYVQILAKGLHIPERSIGDALARTKTLSHQRTESKAEAGEEKKSISGEEILVGLLIKFPQYLDQVAADLDYQDFSPDSLSQKIYKFLQSCYTKASCDGKKGACDYRHNIKDCLETKIESKDKEKVQLLLLGIEESYQRETPEEIGQEITFLSQQVKTKKREKLKDEFAQRIKEAEEKGDHPKLKELLWEFQRLIGK